MHFNEYQRVSSVHVSLCGCVSTAHEDSSWKLPSFYDRMIDAMWMPALNYF